MSVTIERVSTSAQLKRYIMFPMELYRGVLQYVPELISDEKKSLTKNPAFEGTEVKLFLAYKDGKLAGRIGAIRALRTLGAWKPEALRFTRVDFVDDDEVVDALFGAVMEWGREIGAAELKGPLGFCDLEKEGMLVEGFEHTNTFITLYNYAYYPRQLERLGFEKDADWLEFQITVPKTPNERVERLAGIVQKRNKLTLVNVRNARELKPNLEAMFGLLNEAYRSLYGVTTITPAQVKHYVGQFLPLVNLDFVKFLYDDKGMAAFGAAFPSIGKAIKASGGRLLPFGLFRILRAKKKNDILDLLLVAVRPDLQNKGVNALLMHEMTLTAMKYGITLAESNPELELNEKVQALWSNYEAKQVRRRRSYHIEIRK